MLKGRSLELFFVDGRPDGMLTAQVFNWTGHVLRFPRTQIKEALSRPEAQNTGVYVLIGDQEGEPLAYIGETENFSERLKEHAAKKGWWNDAVLISSAGDSLNKAHVKYLESRLVEKAHAVGAIPLENGNTPPRGSMNEASIANMESFLDTLSMVLPAIRVDMFLEKSRDLSKELPTAKNEEALPPEFELNNRKHDIHAKATLINGEMVVKAGSRARREWMGAKDSVPYSVKLFNDLLDLGILEPAGEYCIFTADWAFSSPSAAAESVNGRSSNGRTEWKHIPSGKTFAEWEAEQLNIEDPNP